MRKRAVLLILFIGILYPTFVFGKDPYEIQWQIIHNIFTLYESGNVEAIGAFLIEESRRTEVESFDALLRGLTLPDNAVSHRFRILDTSRVYRDASTHDFSGIMADIQICDIVTARNVDSGLLYQHTFYLFYHFHFEEKNGVLLLYLGNPYIAEGDSFCTP